MATSSLRSSQYPHLRNVLERDFFLGKNGRGHAGQRRVFCARDAHRTHQRIPAAYDKLSMNPE